MSRKLRTILVPALVGGALLALAGCGGGPDFVSRRNFVEFTPDQKEQLQTESARSYRLQAGDILKIAFFYLKELNQEGVIILPDGSVSLIGIDRAELAGMTVLEADSLLTEAYAREYRSPNLSVIVMKTEGKRVYVTGEVKDPGLYEVPPGGLGIMGAVTLASGFTADAARDAVVLVRVTPEGYLCQEVNLDKYHQVQYAELAAVPLETYDIVYVPRSKAGNFDYYTDAILGGMVNIMRIAADAKYVATGSRY